jgi:hypothetical protein
MFQKVGACTTQPLANSLEEEEEVEEEVRANL